MVEHALGTPTGGGLSEEEVKRIKGQAVWEKENDSEGLKLQVEELIAQLKEQGLGPDQGEKEEEEETKEETKQCAKMTESEDTETKQNSDS